MENKCYHKDGKEKEIDEAFFKKISSPEHHKTYKKIAGSIIKHINPESVVDYGCGTAWIMYYLHSRGVVDIKGIEVSEHAKPFIDKKIIDKILFGSITQKVDFNRRFDLAVCLEVAEHIDEAYSDIIVENLCRNSDRVLFSAAYKGQGGYGHVNEQSMEYWIEKFNANNFKLNKKLTKKIRTRLKNGKVKPWYHKNSRVFDLI